MENHANILITTVAKAVEDDEIEATFIYQSKKYKKLLEWEHFDMLLSKLRFAGKFHCLFIFFLFGFSELSKNTGFFLKQLETDGGDLLVLCFACDIIGTRTNQERRDKTFLMDAFFERCDGTPLDLAENPEKSRPSVEAFYEGLRQAHDKEDLETGLPIDVQHPSLRPLLRPYQKRGIKWMLKREQQTELLPQNFIAIRSKYNKSQVYYYDKYYQQVVHECPEQIEIPTGGLLTGKLKTRIFLNLLIN